MKRSITTETSDFSLNANVLAPLTFAEMMGHTRTGTLGGDTLTGGENADFLAGLESNDTLLGGAGNDTLKGGEDNDLFDGGDGADVLLGGRGADTLQGGAGNDVYNSGGGNDVLTDSGGKDRYLFGKGFGNDTLTDLGGRDTLLLDASVSPDDLILENKEMDLKITIVSTGESFTVKSQFAQDYSYAIERIQFSDGTTWDTQILKALSIKTPTDYNDTLWGYGGSDSINGGNGDDFIRGYDGDDTLIGGLGDDNLQGGTGDDVLDGGMGDDVLLGGSGNNVYLFGKGYGHDHILTDPTTDPQEPTTYTLRFIDDTTADDLIISFFPLSSSFYQLKISIKSTGDFIYSTKQTAIQFADGSSLDTDEILKLANTGASWSEYFYADDNNNTISVLGGNDTVYAVGGADVVLGGTGDDMLHGEAGRDKLDGGAGRDSLWGGDSHDTLQGGTGDDFLSGDRGNDTYLFTRGSGADVISDTGDTKSTDTLLFSTGISLSDISTSRVNYDLILNIANSEDSVTIKNYFYTTSYLNSIETIQFADGSVLDAASITALMVADQTLNGDITNDTLVGLSGSDTIHGAGGADTLIGGAGQDVLYGEAGSDSLVGGSGRDTLYGGFDADTLQGDAGDDILSGDAGNDTYILGTGFGKDTISDTNGTDTLIFSANVALSDLAAFRLDNDLSLIVMGTDDSVVLKNYFAAPTSDANTLIETIQLADGSSLDTTAISQLLLSGNVYSQEITGYASDDRIEGLDGDDTISGADGSDTLLGGQGNDSLTGSSGDDVMDGGVGDDFLGGGTGNDVYLFGRGYGTDRILDGKGSNDTLLFAEGVTLSDIAVNTYKAETSGPFSLGIQLSIIDTGDSVILYDYFQGSSGKLSVENIRFADGSTLDSRVLHDLVTIGNDSNQTLYALANISVIDAQGGDDRVIDYLGGHTLNGGTGNDFLWADGRLDDVMQGGAGVDTLWGGHGNDTLIGGVSDDLIYANWGADVIVLDSLIGSDTVQSFTSGTDKIMLDSACLPVGNGDGVLDGALSQGTPSGFSTSAELVVFTTNSQAGLGTGAAASLIGSASSNYELGDTRVFVIDNGRDSAVYYFQSANTNATVSASELTLLATLTGTASTTTADYLLTL